MRKFALGTLATGLFAAGVATAQKPAVKVDGILPPDEPKAVAPAPPALPTAAVVPASQALPAAAVAPPLAPKPLPAGTAISPFEFPPPADPPLNILTASDADAGTRPVQATPAVRVLELTDSIAPESQKPVTPPVTPAPPINPPATTPPAVTPPASKASVAAVACPPAQTFVTSRGARQSLSLNHPWASAEYLLFFVREDPTPPLVQTITPEAAQLAIANGQLPPNATTDIFDQPDKGAFSGVRGQVGVWLDQCRNWGLEANYIQLFRESDQFQVFSTGVPVIGRNFFDVAAGQAAFLRYTDPNGSQQGFIRIDAPTQAIGGEVNVRHHGVSVFSDWTDYIGGFRYFNLREAVGIDSGAAFFGPAGQVTNVFTSSELFRTRNQFFGPQFGFESHFGRCAWTLDVGGKLAVGGIRQDVTISGGTAVNTPGQPQQFFQNQSLLYVQATNSGNYSRDRFAVMPEFMMRLGYQISPKIRATLGYDIIAISDAVRPGTSIDGTVNPNNTQFIVRNQPSNALRPVFSFVDNTWWAQGLTAGLVMNY